MFFSSRVNVPACSPLYEDAKDAFLQGDVFGARKLVIEIRKTNPWQMPEDALLSEDISRTCGNFRESYATIKIAFKKWPESRILKFTWAIALSNRRYTLRSLALLEELFADASEQEKALIASEFAATYAIGGFQTSARTWIQKCLNFDLRDDPKIYYALACAAYYNRDWENALVYGNQAFTFAPHWPRLRTFLADAYLANGEDQRALELLEENYRNGYRDAYSEWLLGIQHFANGDMGKARDWFSRFEEDWQFSKDCIKPCRTLLAFAHWNCGEYDQANEIIRKTRNENIIKQFSSFQDVKSQITPSMANRKIIPTQLISQEPDLCVPTSVALVASAQGVFLNPRELYNRMKGKGGTYTWKMTEEMERLGFQVYYINCDHDAIIGMLDSDIPLIGEIDNPFVNHVEVICGYDKVLKICYIRDPIHWSSLVMPFEDLEDRYTTYGNFLIALVKPDPQRLVPIKPEWLSKIGEARICFEAACAQGKIEEAEKIVAGIPQESTVYLHCANIGRGITLTPGEVQQINERFALDDSAPLTCRIRAVMVLANPILFEKLLEVLEQQKENLGLWVIQYIRLRSYLQQGLWQNVLDISKKLLERASGFDVLWVDRAEAYLELGKPELAKDMLSRALDISPESRQILERIRFINRKIMPFQDKIKELNQAIKDFPEDLYLKDEYALLMLDSGKGLEYEEAELEFQRYFPKAPYSYQRLADWYLYQGRESLARETLERGRKLVGVKELPYFEFEQEAAEPDVIEKAIGENIVSLLQMANGAVNAGNYLHPDELEIIRKLLAMQGEGKLKWFEYNQLLALRIYGIIKAFRFANNFQMKEAVVKILPEQLPGTTILTLDHFLEQCGLVEFPRLAAVAMLEWCQKFCLDSELSPNLRFHIGLLKEISNDLIGAEKEYKSLQKDFPAYDAAQYRIGMLLNQKRDNEGAIIAFEAAVSLRPGLTGAMFQLAELNYQFGRNDDSIFWQQKLCQALPYSLRYLHRLFFTVMEHRGWEKAVNELETNYHYLGTEALVVLKTRILLDAGQLAKAEEISELTLSTYELKRYHASGQLEIALKVKDDATIDRFIQELLEEWPQDVWFHEHKAKRLAKNNTEEAMAYLKDVLSRGIISAELAQTYLEISEQGLPGVIEILEKAKESDQIELAESFAFCFKRSGSIRQKMDFLYWVTEKLPHLYYFRAELANDLLTSQQEKEAIRIATALHEEDPENPQWLSLLGDCCRYLDPKKALKYLKKAYEYTGSAEFLTLMGSCYINEHDFANAKSCFWKALECSPYEVAAMTQLVWLGEANKNLLKIYFGAVEKGYGIYNSAFHIGAIELANKYHTPVPLKWIDTAIQRYNLIVQQKVVTTDDPEQGLLGKAIATWLRTRNKKSEARKYRTGFSLIQYFKYRHWPGKKWIPAEH